MLIIPAIDLKDGKCVRLLKGEEGTETIFSENPSSVAKTWEKCGAKLIHVVDLDGAFSGRPSNFGVIRSIVKCVSSSVQVGGGIRNVETIERYIDMGVVRIIIGTAAFSDPDFLAHACGKYSGKIAVGIDTKMGKIVIKGWKEVIDLDTESALANLESVGVSLVIHTDVDRDGTMEGVNLQSVRSFVASSPLPVVGSGGISSMEDIEKLSSLEASGLVGVILGKAVYTGRINLREAIDRFS